MLKILKAQIRGEINYSLVCRGWFPDEQKWWREVTRGKDDLVYVDQDILEEIKAWQKNVVVAWIDNKKANAILDSRLSENVQDLRQSHKIYQRSYEKLESEINCRRKSLAKVKIQKGISQGDALSPLLFVIVMISLDHRLRICARDCKLHK